MLQIRDLHKYYKSKKGEEHHALRGIDLELGSKGFIVLLGKSGSGKSTLLNILGGLDSFDRGEIIIKGNSTKYFRSNEWDSYRNTYVGFVFQEFYIIEEYSVGKNIALALELQGYPKDKIDNRVDEILEQVDLKGYALRNPNEISGGQKQRIAIARALVKDPQIILADEPTGNLDSETGKMILETLKKLSKDKLVIMVTHDADFAREYGDRIIELKDGKVISDQINYIEQSSEEEVYETKGDFESIIKIKKGKPLSQNTINYINKVLLSEDTDFYIALTNNKQFVSSIVPEILDKKVKKTVTLTDDNYDTEFNLKKSSLPFKHAFKLALSSLFTKKVKLVFMNFLFVISLCFVGMASNFSFYDIGKATNLTFKKADIDVLPLIKYDKICNEENNSCYVSTGSFNDDDLKNLRNNYDNIKFTKSINSQMYLSEFVDMRNRYMPGANLTLYDSDYFNKITFVDNDYEAFKLRVGSQKINDYEILITDYIGEMLIKFKVYPDVFELSQLIGKQFTYKDITLKIKGIVETDYHKFDDIKNSNELSNDHNYLAESGFYMKKINVYGQLFMSNNTYKLLFNKYEIANIPVLLNEFENGLYIIKTNEEFNELLIGGKLPHNDFEITPTLSSLNKLGYNFNLDKASFDINEVLPLINNEITFKIPISRNFNKEYKDYKYKIVGIIDDLGLVKNNSTNNMPMLETVIFNPTDFDYLYKNFDFASHSSMNFIMANLSDDDSMNEKFFEDIINLNYRHQTQYSNMLEGLYSLTTNGRTIFYIIGAVFAIFSAFMILTFISSSILAKKKEIGTLRAIGARGIDVSKIFITEGMIIAVISSIFANILLSIVVRLINNSITNEFKVPLVLVYVNLIGISIVFILAIFVVLISTFIPLKRITLMKPIKAIKNN